VVLDFSHLWLWRVKYTPSYTSTPPIRLDGLAFNSAHLPMSKAATCTILNSKTFARSTQQNTTLLPPSPNTHNGRYVIRRERILKSSLTTGGQSPPPPFPPTMVACGWNSPCHVSC
jgi:hypothetical protein